LACFSLYFNELAGIRHLDDLVLANVPYYLSEESSILPIILD
jgi:hypothetical protein